MAHVATAPVAGGIYTLVPGASGKCVQVPVGDTTPGALLTQAACAAGATNQQWRLVPSAGKYNLVNVATGMCIDVPGNSTTSGTQLQQWGCGTAQNNQLWTLSASAATPGKYQIVGAATSQCLSDRNSSTAGGNPIIQETCADIARMQILLHLAGSTTPSTPTVASDGTGQYTTVQAAIDAVPANNTSRVVITIKPGTYREVVTIPSNKPYITLQGLGSAANQTVIVDNHGASAGYGTEGSSTAFVYGHDFKATNLTLSNDYGVGTQAVAVDVDADRAVFDNVRFLGNQDTLLVNKYRAYYVNSYVEGTVDFIFGGAVAVFSNCSIYQKRTTGGPITAASTPSGNTYGILIYKSTITGAADNVTQLGRPWGAAAQVLYSQDSLSATIATAQPWVDMSSNSWKNARFDEYANTGAGATINGNRPQMSTSAAANYTPQKYLAGTDGWNPT
ncbi:pectinesterase family protein [Streptomyces sp. HPF1205]|uniref:pectinesterase family protein n=1 Tax=Streptomyces sp. HPF1205 TaxID=2873262 RepID=UPI001CEC2123|nr:pectinesterase family protein [Streptomyces sp. HPF1205]